MLFLAGDMEARQAPLGHARPGRPGGRDLGVFRLLDPHHATPAHGAGKTQHMGKPTQGNHRPVGEGHGLGQAGDALLQPIQMTGQELVRIGETRVNRHGEDGATAGLAHLQAEATRAEAATQEHRNFQPLYFDFDGLSAPDIQPLQHAKLPTNCTKRGHESEEPP